MTDSPFTQACAAIGDLRSSLARMADVAYPDALDSPGAQFLGRVRDSFLEWADYDRADNFDAEDTLTGRAQDAAWEQVDSCVPVYTHDVWRTFVDLCAYDDEDVREALTSAENVTFGAMATLGRIAERLFVALAEEFVVHLHGARADALGGCEDDSEGGCSGACVTRPHAWDGTARCQRRYCGVVGTGDPCGDQNCEGD